MIVPAPPSRPAGGARRVLICDDNADLRDFMRILLEDAGYDVEVAPDGNKALEAQRNRPAQVLITDIFMPEKEGIETIEDFKAEFPGVRIIAMSGGGDLPKRQDYLSVADVVGADEVLRKPFEAESLLEAVRRLSP